MFGPKREGALSAPPRKTRATTKPKPRSKLYNVRDTYRNKLVFEKPGVSKSAAIKEVNQLNAAANRGVLGPTYPKNPFALITESLAKRFS